MEGIVIIFSLRRIECEAYNTENYFLSCTVQECKFVIFSSLHFQFKSVHHVRNLSALYDGLHNCTAGECSDYIKEPSFV